MSLGTCLVDLQQRKLISDQRAEELGARYAELVSQYEGRYGRAAAESMASEKVMELADLDHLHRRRQVLLQAQAQGAWHARMTLESPEGGPISRRAAEDFVVDMDGHRRSIRQQALGLMSGLLERHRRNIAGQVRNAEDLQDTLAELFGRDTGNLNAREIADSWRQTGEWLRSRFNAAGGRIAKLDSWHLPQRHDMRSVRDAGFDAWRDYLVPLLDRAKMIDRDTGEPMGDGKLELVLRDMWEAIATDGWTRNEPGGQFAGALGNRRADHRVLHFAGPDEWAAYADRFGGGGTPFDAMLSHIEGMSRDIAAMERMGPNPTATLRYQQDWLRKSAAEKLEPGRAGDRSRDDAESGANQLQRLYDEYTGAANRPERRRLALGFSIFRAQQVAAKLGGAALSVGGDYGTMIHSARFDGLPAGKVMARYLSLLNPANAADRAQAARTVLMADQWAEGHAAQWRLTGEEIAHEGARRLASGVLRASGLTAHTDIARQAFGMEVVAHLTHMRDRAYGQLDPAFRALLDRYGIGEARWDALRAIAPEQYKGTDWLYPQTVASAGDQALADDYMRMIVSEADYAVPVPDLRTRAMISSRAPKGTWIGEIIRSGFLFKGFPLTIINMHGRRMLDEAGGKSALASMLVWRYGFSMLALTTIGGALSLQAKEIAKGRDPQDMTTPGFWSRAGLQGGGLGIFGDLLASAENRFGGGVAQTIVGPGAQLVDNTLNLTAGNAVKALDGDPETQTSVGKDAVKLLSHETPGLSLWYARLAIERGFLDLAKEWTDPDGYEAAYRRLDQYAAEQGTAYFAAPGSRDDWRAPDWGNAIGEPQVGAE